MRGTAPVTRRDFTRNALPAVVESIAFMGEALEYKLGVSTATLSVRGRFRVMHQPGDSVWLQIPDDACTVISDEHGVAAAAAVAP